MQKSHYEVTNSLLPKIIVGLGVVATLLWVGLLLCLPFYYLLRHWF